MKKFVKKKLIDQKKGEAPSSKNEIIFRLKRPNDKQTLDFIYLEDQESNTLKKQKQNPQNEQNLYKQFDDLSINPLTTTSNNLFTNSYRLKRVEISYVKKKQEEMMEKLNSQYRMEKFQKNRMILTNEEKKEDIPTGIPNLSKIIEKYKKLEEEELKSSKPQEEIKKEENEIMVFYDLNYKKNEQNAIMINEMPTEFNYLMESKEKTKVEEQKMEIETQETDYYILEKYEPGFNQFAEKDPQITKVELDLNLLKPYHYDNYFDEFQNLVQERNEESVHNEDSCDSNSENNPNNDYPEEQNSGEDGEKDSFDTEDHSKERSEKSEICLEEEQENEFYESFKKKVANSKPKEFLEDDNYDDF